MKRTLIVIVGLIVLIGAGVAVKARRDRRAEEKARIDHMIWVFDHDGMNQDLVAELRGLRERDDLNDYNAPAHWRYERLDAMAGFVERKYRR